MTDDTIEARARRAAEEIHRIITFECNYESSITPISERVSIGEIIAIIVREMKGMDREYDRKIEDRMKIITVAIWRLFGPNCVENREQREAALYTLVNDFDAMLDDLGRDKAKEGAP